MSIQPVNNAIVTPINTQKAKNNPTKRQENLEKLGVAATSALGVASALALISKRQGFSLSPSRIAKTPIKDWAIFKITNKEKNNGNVLDFKAKEILTMGAGSVLGGLIGGTLFNKDTSFKDKCNEAVNQMLGDIAIPLGFVAGPTALYKNFEELAKRETKHVTLQKVSKFIQGNKFLSILCPTVISAVSLGTGIIAGNKTSNYINEKVHGIKVDRKIRITDFAPHIDDVCLVVSLMAEKGPIPDIISRLVPIALTIAGIETGTAKTKEVPPKQLEQAGHTEPAGQVEQKVS